MSGTDATAIADLQASPEWTQPRCRWLTTGAHVLAYSDETAVYEAASALGYIEMVQIGTGNRTGRIEPAWRIRLHETGRAVSATCGNGSSRPSVFGVPVSQRRFLSSTRTKEPDVYNPDRTEFQVQFEWTPTPAGDAVKNVLTGHMTVEQGLATATVAMRYGPGVWNRGANGWAVAAIHDTRPRTER